MSLTDALVLLLGVLVLTTALSEARNPLAKKLPFPSHKPPPKLKPPTPVEKPPLNNKLLPYEKPLLHGHNPGHSEGTLYSFKAPTSVHIPTPLDRKPSTPVYKLAANVENPQLTQKPLSDGHYPSHPTMKDAIGLNRLLRKTKPLPVPNHKKPIHKKPYKPPSANHHH